MDTNCIDVILLCSFMLWFWLMALLFALVAH